tara:strand:- start:175 stop:642 length:468 start_codon:yes stop_codon:yes gene_type:complete
MTQNSRPRPRTLRDYQPEPAPKRARHSADFEDYLNPHPLDLCRHEASLWRAVITQALTDALSYSEKSETAQERFEAIDWLCGLSRDYRQVCDYGNLDPVWVHRQIHRFLTAHAYAHPEWPGAIELVRARARYARNTAATKSWLPTLHCPICPCVD